MSSREDMNSRWIDIAERANRNCGGEKVNLHNFLAYLSRYSKRPHQQASWKILKSQYG